VLLRSEDFAAPDLLSTSPHFSPSLIPRPV
jgi:hypothetical protein